MDPTILLAAALMAAAQPKEDHMAARNETQAIASTSLETFKRMVTKENYRGIGFETPDEVNEASLGEPILDYMVRLDELRAYQSQEPSSLLHATNQATYPVLVRTQPRSSITLAKREGGWTPVSYGSSKLARAVTRARASSALKTKLPESEFFQVRIPAFNLYFLGFRASEGLMLVPVFDDARFGFKAEVAVPASGVFAQLQPAAKAHNGLPQ